MNVFEQYYIEESIDEEIFIELKNKLNSYESMDWQNLYWAAKLVEKHGFGRYDDQIIKLLEESLSKGLNLSKNSELYLDASKILAKKYFMYNINNKANNHLLMLRDIEGDKAPDWIFLYSAALSIKQSLEYNIANPVELFEFLDQPNMTDELIKQRDNIVKDFLNKVTEFISKFSKDQPLKINYNVIVDSIKRIGLEIDDELNNFEEAYRIYEFEHQNKNDFTLNNEFIIKTIIDQKNKIKTLEDNISSVCFELSEIRDLIAKTNSLVDNSPNQIEVKTEFIEKPDTDYIITGRKPKLLIFGASKVSVNDLRGIAKSLGIEVSQLDFQTDYENNKRYDFEKIRYNSPFAGILIGPNAHNMVNVGSNSSIIQKLMNEEGYPHVEQIKTNNGHLKITKSAFKEALERMITYLSSIDVQIVQS